MNLRSIGLGFSLLLTGCAATVVADDAGDPPGPSAAAPTSKTPGTAPSSSAHLGLPESGSSAPEPNPNGKPNGEACGKGSDCQSGACEGEGCDPATTKAVCVATDRMCTRDFVTYCGCDGKEFGGSGSCAGKPYKNKGSCK
ncbi:MAG: hypothetical protein U0414_38050 [Polyangiaceae bacterium]